MSVVTVIPALTPAPDSAPPVTKVTTSTTLKLLSAASTMSVSLVGTPMPSARSVAEAPSVTSVVTLRVVCAAAPAALTIPPVVPLMFCDVEPDSGGFWMSLKADMTTLPALTRADAPILAVTAVVTALSIAPPVPARMPPARLTICALNVAVCTASMSKVPASVMVLPAPIEAMVVLVFVVSETAAATAYSPPDPAPV